MSDRPKIVRLFGRADNFDIEFHHKGGAVWQCTVPSDTVDGIYAVEITAVNEYGETAFWTGELFLCNGVCHFELNIPKYTMWLFPCSQMELSKPNEMAIDCNNLKFDLFELTKLIIKKGCKHELL